MVFKASGDDELWKNEIGCHRIQRVPPTERKGRVHTSSITIVVLPEITEKQFHIRPNEIEWRICRSSGPGGQNVNKVESAVQVIHLPTKTMVRCEYSRDQHRNKAMAIELLRTRLWEKQKNAEIAQRTADRKEQIGTGERGDKRRTVASARRSYRPHNWKTLED
jgi:peptide chain release factor 1